MMSETEWLRNFSEALKERLEYANMTQKELAEATGLSEGAISGYVNGTKIPKATSIVKIFYELNLDTFDEILDFGDTIE